MAKRTALSSTLKLGGSAITILVLCLFAALSADKLGWERDLSPDGRFTIHPRLHQLVDDLPTTMRLVGVCGSHSEPNWMS